MSSTKHLTLARLGWFCLVASAACRSTPPEPPSPITRAASHAEELTLIRADSEVFDAVVRAQLAGRDDEYPFHLEHLRYDSRPYGTPSGYPEVFAGVQGIDPSLSFPRPGKPTIDRLAKNRKRILQQNDVPEGPDVNYAQCAGARVPEPPPPRGGSAARSKKTLRRTRRLPEDGGILSDRWPPHSRTADGTLECARHTRRPDNAEG